MIRVAVVGLGKMGLSHYALLNAHPDVEVAAICDSSSYVLGTLGKYTGVKTCGDYGDLLAQVQLDAVVIATPSSSHVAMAQAAMERGLHVFCEKPLTLDPADAERLAATAAERGLVTQVGYHNRFVGAFAEVKRLLDLGAIGRVTHVFGEAYGPVVLKPKGRTWRSQRSEGGGCLYDYAAHVLNLVNWYLGEPVGIAGTTLPRLFSNETEDAAFSTMHFAEGQTGQLAVNWSEESYRKMTTRITISGTEGRLFADRQECQAYLREEASIPNGYEPGWNVRFTTELTAPVWFYLRGEEYSAQIESFVQRIAAGASEGLNDFASAAATDRTIAMLIDDAASGALTTREGRAARDAVAAPARTRRRWLWRRAAA